MRTRAGAVICVSLVLIQWFAAPPATAGSQTGAVVYLYVRASDGLHYFTLSGAKVDSPACATHSYWMIKDENSVAGRSQIAMLLHAMAQGKQLTVYGANACTRWGDGEDVDAIVLTP